MSTTGNMIYCASCQRSYDETMFEHLGGGSRPDFSSGEKLELNWIDLRCLVCTRDIQLSWFEGGEEESEEA